MELAGLACAQATHDFASTKSIGKRILTICGPGSKFESFLTKCVCVDNGGDGLVAARHLKLFGYEAAILYPKKTDNPVYSRLVK